MAATKFYSSRVDINSPISIGATIFIAISGWVVFMAMPLLVGALADLRGYSNSQIGYLASAELGGMFLASVFTSLLVRRINRRVMAAIGLIMSLAINVLAVSVGDYQTFLVLRAIAGFGSGLCYSIAIANLAGTQNSTRNYSVLVFVLVASNAVLLYGLPQLIDSFGLGGIFYTFAVFNLASLFFIPFIVPKVELKTEVQNEGQDKSAPVIFSWLCIIAVACFYACIAAFWAYIERRGVEAGFTSEFIGSALALSTLLSMVGCYIAFQVSKRVGQSIPLIITLAVITFTILVVAIIPNAAVYLISLTIYQLLWNGIDIYQLGTLSNIDKTGRYVALVAGAQGLGQMVGPFSAATLIAMGYGFREALFFAAAASFTALLIYLAVHILLIRKGNYDPVSLGNAAKGAT